MSSQLPGNLAEIFPLRLRLRKEFRFFQAGNQVIAERTEDLQRFSVRSWQYEMFLRFDGKRTFEEASKEVFQRLGGGFTAVGLLNFYRWLYQEDLVFCECDSVFELVGHEEEFVAVEDAPPEATQVIQKPNRILALWRAIDDFLPGKPAVRRAAKIAAIIIFGISVLRLGYVAAPVFESPVNRVYAGVEKIFGEEAPASQENESQRELVQSPKREVHLAGRIPSTLEPSQNGGATVDAVIPDIPPVGSPETPPPAERDVKSKRAHMAKIEELRRRISECRIRRDEFYIQNNEAGYRQEVAKMSALAKEIGAIEAKL